MPDSRVIRTTIEIGGESAYRTQLKQIDKALRGIASESKVVDAQYAKDDQSLAALTARYGNVQDKLDLQKKKLAAIKTEYDRIVAAEGENSDSARKMQIEYNYASAQVIRTEKNLQSLGNAMQSAAEDADDLTDATADAKKAWNDFGEQVEQTANKLSKALVGATTAAVTVSVKGYMEFEQEMNNVETLADTTAVSMEELSKQAIAASNATGIAAKEVAQGAYTALSAGVDTANAMSFVTQASKAAKAGQSDLSTVVDGSTSIINAWKMSYADAQTVFEKMLITQDKGKTTLGEISQQIGQITGLAPQLNMSLDETLACIAALTKNGVQTSSAISGLKAVMSNILKPTSEAAEEAKRLGLEFNAAALHSKGLTGFLADVMQKTNGDSESLAKLFGSVEGLSQIMLLGGSAASDYADALAAMETSAGRLDEAFATVTKGSGAQLSMQMNRLKNAAVEFGQTLAPYLGIATDALGKLNDTIASMSAEEQKGLLQTALWVSGGLAMIGSISKLTKAFTAMTSPLGIAVTAVAALTAGIIALANVAKRESLDEVWTTFYEKTKENLDATMTGTIDAELNTAPAQIDIDQAVAELREKLKNALTDGKPDTDIVVEGLIGDTSGMFEDLYTQIDELIGDEGKAQEYKAELETLESETVDWIQEMSGKSAGYVEAHMAELDSIMERVREVTEEINAATLSASATQFELVRAGATTNPQTIAAGVQYAANSYKLEKQAVEDDYSTKHAELFEKYSNPYYWWEYQNDDWFSDAESALDAETAAKQAELKTIYETRMTELFQGIREAFAEKYPEEMAKLEEAYALLGERDNIASAMSAYLYNEGEDGIDAGMIANAMLASDKMDAISKQIADVMSEMDTDNPFYSVMQSIFSSDAFAALGIDTSDMESFIKTAMGTIGANASAGLAEGLADVDGSVSAAATELADNAIDSAKTAFDEHSPSKKFYAIGENVVQGLINGIISRENALVTRMRLMAVRAVNAAKQELQINSPSRVFFGIGEFSVEGMIGGINAKADKLHQTVSHTFGGTTQNTTNYGATNYSFVFENPRIQSESDARDILQKTTKYIRTQQRGKGM